MSEVQFNLAAGTNVGLIRKNNEDNFIVSPDLATSQWLIPVEENYVELGPYGALLVVADGMGGMNAGEIASAIAVDTIKQMFTTEAIEPIVDDSKAIQKFMEQVVKSADRNILDHSKTDEGTEGMGTTIVMAWILGQRAYVCWCGDSRCYVFNHKRGLKRLSKDHSYVQELVDKGELLPEYANDHPLSNIITRCLGNEENRAVPETKIYELHNGDVIMLCSDGLSSMCYDDIIAEVIDQFRKSPKECRDELISAALSKGGHDNVTVALCCIKMDSEDEEEDEPVEEETDPAPVEEEPEELSDTVRNKPKKRSKWFLWVFLLIVLAALAAFLYYFKFMQIK